ncbi:MAG: pyridoxal phosphate-dependent aminotransferase [Clostridiales bacterium]|jgi:cystathionine beta-lyase|nr:pyridoxal phosphate-dependent aminotransferase [Clostridiales bacterium]
MFSFDKKINRAHTGSIKYEIAEKHLIEKDYIPLTVADMEFEVAPAIKQALIDSVEHGIYGYTMPDDAYINSVMGFMKRHHNYAPNRESLLITSGIVPALGMAIRAFTNEGDPVLFQPPVYAPFLQTIKGNGRFPVENPLVKRNGRYEMDFKGLENILKSQKIKLMILCSPHNPVGRVWSEQELKTLASISKKYDLIIVSDEIHSDITYSNTHTVLANIDDMRERAVTCMAVSKTFNMAGLVCSNIFVENPVLFKELRRRVIKEGNSTIPYFARVASIAAYNSSDEWLSSLLDYLQRNLEMCYNFIDEYLPQISYTKAEGTYLLWLDFSKLGMSDTELESFMINKAEIDTIPGIEFGTGGEGHIRVNIAIPKCELLASLERLRLAVSQLERKE